MHGDVAMRDRNFDQQSDLLQIEGDLVPGIDAGLDKLLEAGKTGPVQILDGTEGQASQLRPKYATTHVAIKFDNEDDLRQCVRLLRWSDERLKLRPDEQIRWDWQTTTRDGMEIRFGVNWYEREFFEQRRNAFKDSRHASYYALFGADPSKFQMSHEVLNEKGCG